MSAEGQWFFKVAAAVIVAVLSSATVFSALAYLSLKVEFDSLKKDFDQLKEKYDELEASYNELKAKYDELEQSYSELQVENEQLRQRLEQYEKVPHGYYPETPNSYKKSYDELCNFLTYQFSLPTGYQPGVFDCSELSAYLEWALENNGFDAYIAVGPCPWNPSEGYHAWVLVYVSDYTVAIEPTSLVSSRIYQDTYPARTPGVVYQGDSWWYNYYHGYDKLYKNIYQAIDDYGVDEWNWWEGYWGFA